MMPKQNVSKNVYVIWSGLVWHYSKKQFPIEVIPIKPCNLSHLPHIKGIILCHPAGVGMSWEIVAMKLELYWKLVSCRTEKIINKPGKIINDRKPNLLKREPNT